MLPSDTAGWIGLTLALIVALPVAAIALLLIIDNTKALNQEKELRQRLAALNARLATMTPDTPMTDIEALQRDIAEYDRYFTEWKRSPFVVSRP
jgi:hypothetical protein